MSVNGGVAAVDLEWFAGCFRALGDSVERIIQGKREVIDLALITLMAEGHLLLEDVPGTGKTSLARSFAATIGGHWSRIQFTPDLLPTDVTGVSVWNQSSGEFEFRPGPVFTNVLIGDEINRASPKTQSALLEVMEERQVTQDGLTRAVPRPFMVIATQNPTEHQGTYRLPEAQLDRFLMRLSLGYPDHDAEMRVIDLSLDGVETSSLPAVTTVDQARLMIGAGKSVHVAPALKDYAVRVTRATRDESMIKLGASPRATVALIRAAQVRAAAAGRPYVVPQDVKELVVPVLAHRLQLANDATMQAHTAESVLAKLLESVPVPTQRAAA